MIDGGPHVERFSQVVTAGFAATAISYGPARMGFGLFVPEFRAAFSMSTTTVGLVSALGFLGFFLGLLITGRLLDRRGPVMPVLSGLSAATAGLVIVAVAPNPGVLALGVFLAASSAGFAWTPFNDAVHRKIRDVDRPTALSEISTGTSAGIVLAAALALAMVLSDIDWRICWALFAALGGLSLGANWLALRDVDKAATTGRRPGWHDLMHTAALPLFVIAFVFGTTSAIYISFAADHLLQRGGVPGLKPAATPAVMFIVYGLFGLMGLVTAWAKSNIGLPWLARLLMMAGALSLALLALSPIGWAGLIGSAGLQGLNVMMTSALLAFWSARLFPAIPAFSFTATLMATAAGSVIGPTIGGAVADAIGASAMFAGAAALPALAAMILRDRDVQERPAQFVATASA